MKRAWKNPISNTLGESANKPRSCFQATLIPMWETGKQIHYIYEVMPGRDQCHEDKWNRDGEGLFSFNGQGRPLWRSKILAETWTKWRSKLCKDFKKVTLRRRKNHMGKDPEVWKYLEYWRLVGWWRDRGRAGRLGQPEAASTGKKWQYLELESWDN